MSHVPSPMLLPKSWSLMNCHCVSQSLAFPPLSILLCAGDGSCQGRAVRAEGQP